MQPKSKPRKIIRVTTSMSPGDHEVLKRIAVAHDMSISQVNRRILRDNGSRYLKTLQWTDGSE